ncbi:MAG: Na-translocating system protein MpsC family protein [Solirubrobacterales bacterium]
MEATSKHLRGWPVLSTIALELAQPEQAERAASPSANISKEVIAVLKSELGRGPTKAKTYLLDECVLILLREGHTRQEETNLRASGGRSVAQGRVDVSEAIREPLISVVERQTGRSVVGFMSSSQQNPSLLSFVFVLAGELASAPA